MEKHCEICQKNTEHDPSVANKYNPGGCLECHGAKIVVKDICDAMSVCRQAVYTKADRKGFKKRWRKPEKGKEYRIFTQNEADIIIKEDNRHKHPETA